MHRSGTSAITSLLEPIGVHLGTLADLRDDAAGDAHGYWEHRGLKAVSEDLLHRLGADWHRPPLLTDGWQNAATFDDLRAHARRVVAAHASGHPLWGWKDPRTSLTLPFWKPLLPDVRYVVCLRHPTEAARSLEVRDGLPLVQGLRLWLAYTGAAIIHTAGAPRLLLFYEHAVADPVVAMEALATFLDRLAPPADEALRRVTPDRRHERVSPIERDRDVDPGAPDAVGVLYAALRAAVGPRGLRTASDDGILDAAAAAALAAQRVEALAQGAVEWQAPSAPPASALADAWQRVRGGLGPG